MDGVNSMGGLDINELTISCISATRNVICASNSSVYFEIYIDGSNCIAITIKSTGEQFTVNWDTLTIEEFKKLFRKIKKAEKRKKRE